MGGTTIRRDHRASATGGDKSKVAVTVLQDGVAVTPTIIVGRGDTTAAAREMIAAVNEAAAAGVDPVTSGAGQAAAYAGAQAAQQSSNQRLLLYGALGVAALAGLFIVRKKR
ncbi:MAG: hypothetical protein R3322_00275 [Kiloniellales bacterium]|nr:hypothetical protein [Kiloniellales bacterium]